MNSDPSLQSKIFYQAASNEETVESFRYLFSKAIGTEIFNECTAIASEINKEGQAEEPISIGSLLVKLGMITIDLLSYADSAAAEMGLPVGRILVMSGWLTDCQLNVASQLQSMLYKKEISQACAIEAATILAESNCTLAQALERMGIKVDRQSECNLFARLAVDSALITEEKLREAESESLLTGLPLGSLLVTSGALTAEHLTGLLNAHTLVKESKLSYIDGVELVKRSVETHHAPHPVSRLVSRQIRLGELLVLSGHLLESELACALEVGMIKGEPIGQVLCSMEYLAQETVNYALYLHHAVRDGSISPFVAIRKLASTTRFARSAKRREETGLHAVADYSLADFLKQAGYLNEELIEKALDVARKNSELLARLLLVAGIVDEPTAAAALKCLLLANEQVLSLSQAIDAFDFSQRCGVRVATLIDSIDSPAI